MVFIYGKKGAGKSTLMTKISIMAFRKGIKVYTTTPIAGAEYFDYKQIGYRKFDENSILLIDEVSLIWDNRDWKNMDKHVVEFFRYLRKNRISCYLFSQSFDIDKKLRDLTDSMYLTSNFMRVWSISRKINKRITVSRPKDNEDGTNKNGVLVEDYSFAPIFMPGSIKFTFIPRWRMFFDSFDVEEKEKVKSEVVQFNGQQYSVLSKKGYFIYFVSCPYRWIRKKCSCIFRKRQR